KLRGFDQRLTTGRPLMSPASHGAHMSQIGRTVALLRSHASFGDLVALMKPRVMSLVVFTALVGLLVAPGHLDPLIGFVALLFITAGAGAAGVLNMWYDADIDAVMTRTAMRPIPRGRVSRTEALAFGRDSDQTRCTQARRIANHRGRRKPAAKANPELGYFDTRWSCGARRNRA